MAKKGFEDRGQGLGRREVLECMVWAGTGVLWTVGGGVPHSVGLIVPDRDPLTPIVSALLQITNPAAVAEAIDRAAGVLND